MFIKTARRSHLAVCAIVLGMALGACGGDGDNGGGGSAGADGAASPDELVSKMQVAVNNDDFPAMLPLLVPKQRAMITFGVYMGAEMMVGMSTRMAGMGGDEGQAAAKKLSDDWSAIKKRHGLPGDKGAKPEGLDTDDKDQMIEGMNKLLGHVDHAAFLKDALAFMRANKDPDEEGGAMDTMKGTFKNLKVDGESGTVELEKDDGTETVGIVKIDGRWYADLKDTM